MTKGRTVLLGISGALMLALTGCCWDDMGCGGSNTYVPVSSCYTCSSPCRPVVNKCRPSCTVCGYDGSYAYTSWY